MSNDLYDLAPPDKIYVCGACGKTSRNRAGFDLKTGKNFDDTSKGWDESCMLNAVLCHKQRGPAGQWIQAGNGR